MLSLRFPLSSFSVNNWNWFGLKQSHWRKDPCWCKCAKNHSNERYSSWNKAFFYSQSFNVCCLCPNECVQRLKERKSSENKKPALAAFVNKTNIISITQIPSGFSRAGLGLWLRDPAGWDVFPLLFSGMSKEENRLKVAINLVNFWKKGEKVYNILWSIWVNMVFFCSPEDVVMWFVHVTKSTEHHL